jgi:hypothetical protein
METDMVREACFNLATSLMWEKDSLTIDKIEQNFTELSEIADKLNQIALDNFSKLENLENGKEILVQAINFI